MTHETYQQMIAQADAVAINQEAFVIAMEAQSEAIEAHTEAMKAQTLMMQQLINTIEELSGEVSALSEYLAPCDFTGWSLSETITNLGAEVALLRQK